MGEIKRLLGEGCKEASPSILEGLASCLNDAFHGFDPLTTHPARFPHDFAFQVPKMFPTFLHRFTGSYISHSLFIRFLIHLIASFFYQKGRK